MESCNMFKNGKKYKHWWEYTLDGVLVHCKAQSTHTLIHTWGKFTLGNSPTGLFLEMKTENPEETHKDTCETSLKLRIEPGTLKI